MKDKILPFSVIIIFGLIFFIFYKGLDDSKIYAPEINTKKEIPVFNTKEFFSEEVKDKLGILSGFHRPITKTLMNRDTLMLHIRHKMTFLYAHHCWINNLITKTDTGWVLKLFVHQSLDSNMI